MAKFSKVIEIDEDTQVLIFIEYNVKTDKYVVSVLTDIGGLQGKLSFEFNTPEVANNVLNDFSPIDAHEFVNNIKTELIGD